MRRLKKHERNVETLGTDIFELSLLKSHDAHPVILKIWPQASSPLAKFKLFNSSFSLTQFFYLSAAGDRKAQSAFPHDILRSPDTRMTVNFRPNRAWISVLNALWPGDRPHS
jgi:hypothetical protein